MGAPSLPPGRYFRMHMVGYFERIDSERGLVWRCSDSYSLRDFLRLANRGKILDHSWLSEMRSRLPHEAHEKVFGWVLNLVAERGLVKGERIGVDGSTMEANAALRTIVREYAGGFPRRREETRTCCKIVPKQIEICHQRKVCFPEELDAKVHVYAFQGNPLARQAVNVSGGENPRMDGAVGLGPRQLAA
jgi:hypothetical protein